jgi:hypothetical protein
MQRRTVLHFKSALFINFFFVLFDEKNLIFSGKGAEIKRFVEVAGP